MHGSLEPIKYQLVSLLGIIIKTLCLIRARFNQGRTLWISYTTWWRKQKFLDQKTILTDHNNNDQNEKQPIDTLNLTYPVLFFVELKKTIIIFIDQWLFKVSAFRMLNLSAGLKLVIFFPTHTTLSILVYWFLAPLSVVLLSVNKLCCPNIAVCVNWYYNVINNPRYQNLLNLSFIIWLFPDLEKNIFQTFSWPGNDC